METTSDITIKVVPIKDAREKLKKSNEAWKSHIPKVSEIIYNAVNEAIKSMELNHTLSDRITIDLGSNEKDKFTALNCVLEAYRKEGYIITIINETIKDINCTTNGQKTLLVRVPPDDDDDEFAPNIIPEPISAFVKSKSINIKEDM